MEDQHRQRDQRELLPEPLVGADHLRQRLRRLRLVGDQRILVHRLHDRRIARELLVFQMQDVRVRGEVAQTLENREREIGRRHFMREALADQSGEVGRVLERVNAGDDAAGAVAEHEERDAGLARLREMHERGGVPDVVAELLDEEALALGAPAPPEIDRIHREPAGRQLIGDPRVVAAVGVEAGNNRDDGTDAGLRPPRSNEQFVTVGARHPIFVGLAGGWLRHVPLLVRAQHIICEALARWKKYRAKKGIAPKLTETSSARYVVVTAAPYRVSHAIPSQMALTITAIVCAFNESRLLPGCLYSLKAQTRPPDDILVINNASTDQTAAVARAVPGVRVVDEPRKGLVVARETARRAAHTDLLAFLDADCRAPITLLARAMTQFERGGCVAVTGPYRFYDWHQTGRTLIRAYDVVVAPPTHAVVHDLCGIGAVLYGGNFIVRSDTLASIGGFDQRIEFHGE